MTAAPDRLALAEVLELRNRAGARNSTKVPGTGVRLRAALSNASVHWLVALWQQCDAPSSGVALACTGSLARRESGPLSDLDLVVLHAPGIDAGQVARVAELLWYPIWDSGIPLDHAVRSVRQCRQVAAGDLNVAGAMLDLSPIAGDADLVRRAVRQLAEDWRANARKRLPELLTRISARHERYGELAQMLEPDLKEAKGGLRDMSVLRALTASWLTDRPHGEVDAAYTFLLDVRDTVHLITRRPRTLLAKEDQAEVAERLGLSDADELLSRGGTAARRISLAVDGTLRRAAQSQRARLHRPGPRRPDMTPLHPGVYAHDGEVVLGPARGVTAEETRLLTLRAAAISATLDLPLSPVTARKLVELPQPATPWSDAARALITDLLAGPGLLQTWNTLDLSGVIDLWLPEWIAIRDRPQRSPLHRHTVDRHSLECVGEAVRLTGRVQRPDLLLVAALLHDLGKRPAEPAQQAFNNHSTPDPGTPDPGTPDPGTADPGTADRNNSDHTASDQEIPDDHSARAVPLVRAITARQGWSRADAETLVLLVAEHLTLMMLATTQDTTDPATAGQLARHVGHDLDTLRLLAALSEADARAAGTRTWTSGRAALMRDLVARTESVIQGCAEAVS